MRWIRRHLRRSSLLPGLAVLAMVGKLLVPPGFMADQLDADGWLVVCPEGLPAGLVDHHHDGDDHDSGSDTRTGVQHCPIGATTASPGLLPTVAQIAPVPGPHFFLPTPIRLAPRRYAARAQARAPPRLLTI